MYVPNGGRLAASGFPLVVYIAFAYKIAGNQAQTLVPQLPEWAETDRYDIEARAQGNPGKDEMRALMRALLADRFALKIHAESREVPALAFVLDKTGKTGPQLWPRTENGDCPTQSTPSAPGPVATGARGLPTLCNGIFTLPTEPGPMKLGARNITLPFLADSLSAGVGVGRPMVDQTGITGRVDFLLDFVPERAAPPPTGADAASEVSGPTLQQALREQLGIKLQSTKARVHVIVLDHVERPSAN